MLMHCTIVSVAITFWISIMWGGWPFRSLIRNPVASGIMQLVASYGVTYGLFRVFFNYDFMKEAPVYVASLDPHGLFNAWSALVYIVTALSIMFLMLHFELWPLTLRPAFMKQPVLGLVWTAIALIAAAGVFCIGINVIRNGYGAVHGHRAHTVYLRHDRHAEYAGRSAIQESETADEGLAQRSRSGPDWHGIVMAVSVARGHRDRKASRGTAQL